jgi:hypothetical protein
MREEARLPKHLVMLRRWSDACAAVARKSQSRESGSVQQLLEVAAEEFRRFHVHVPRTFVIT